MKFIDLFAGLGGFHLAGQNVGGECVFACELDESLRKTYRANFGIEPKGDINDVKSSKVPSHDLLCAGFPCQPFSKAGDQAGWADAVRGNVFNKVVEILRAKKPKYLILENVAHFVKHDEGNTYARVCAALKELGYAVKHAQLSPHEFGVPQIRERMYMVGKLGANSLDGFEFPSPETEGSELSIKSVLDDNPRDAMPLSEQVTNCLDVWQEFLTAFPEDEKLPSFPIWSMEFGASYPTCYDNLHEAPIEELIKSRGSFGASLETSDRSELLRRVPSHARHLTKAFPRWKQTFIRQNRDLFERHRKWLPSWITRIEQFPSSLQKCEWNCQGEKRDIWKYVIQFRASGVRIKRPTTAPSLVAMTTSQIPIVAWEKRYMTAKECARLQCMSSLRSLPSGNEAYYALGNAVNVTVATKVLENLLSDSFVIDLLPRAAIPAPV